MAEWFSIEVLDGATSATSWADAYGDALLESALSAGAKDWSWQRSTWGVVLEVQFDDVAAWEAWRELPGARAALEAVPDPLSGLIVYRGRGGASGSAKPRRPRPLAGAGSAVLPLPWDWGQEGPVLLPGACRRPLALQR